MAEDYIIRNHVCLPLPAGSFGEILHKTLQENRCDDDAMIDAINGEKISHDQFFVQTCKLAIALQGIGVRRNDTVAVCSESSIYFFQPVIAAIYVGAVAVPTSHLYTEGEMVDLLSITQPKILFCSCLCVDKVLAIKHKLPSIRKIILLDSTKSGVESLESLISSVNVSEVNVFSPLKNVDVKDQVALILYSSGTTGLPKAVMITHQNLLASLTARSYNVFHCGTDLSMFSNTNLLKVVALQLNNVRIAGILQCMGGVKVGLLALLFKITEIFLSKFDPNVYLKAIEKYKIPVLLLVPPIAVFLQKTALIDKYDLSSVKEITCGGAPLTKEITDSIKARLKLTTMRQGYGLTETAGGVTINPDGHQRSGSIGKLAPFMTAKIVDPSTGKSLGPGKNGELCLKGELIMKGYYRNAAATAEIFDKDGWLHTGDVGYYDEDEFFYIVDRLKELIKFKGFQVAPAELEKVLLSHPKVEDAGVVGIPDERAGELPLAFVVKQPNVALTGKEVQDFVSKQVAPYKQLRGGVIFINEVPKTASGKIMRRKLKLLVNTQQSKL